MKPHSSNGEKIKSYHELSLSSTQIANQQFKQLRLRLFNINEWKNFFGNPSPEFVLMDQNVSVKTELPEKGDFIRIDLPGPGTVAGEGYDWVIIEEVYELENEAEEFNEVHLKVRPAPNPEKPENETAHFYTENSSSEFCVGRKKNMLYGWVKATGEEPNIEEAKGLVDKLRNIVVGFSAKSGLSELQWEQFMNSMLKF